MAERVEDRVDRAWVGAREWFEAMARDPEASFNVRFGEVELRRAGACLLRLKRRARAAYTSCVWIRPEDFDERVTGIRRGLRAFRAGKLAALSLHYEFELGRFSCSFLLNILRLPGGGSEVRGYTLLGFVKPEGAAAEKFRALAGYALEIAELLGAGEVWVGPDSKEVVGEPGSRWVRV